MIKKRLKTDDRKPYSTLSGIPIKECYYKDDLDNFNPETDLGDPGQYPFTRGIHPNMYRGKLWTMRQFAGFGRAKDTNARFKFLLEHGETGLSTAFDLPTLYGRDSDDPFAKGEVGKMGVVVDTLADCEILFSGIPLDKISTSFTINSPAIVIFAMYLAIGERQGVLLEKLTGTIQNDMFKEYHAQNEWIYPPQPSLRLITDIFEFAKDKVPKFNTISISGYHIREAGSTAVQELAFTLADGFAYLEAGIRKGLAVDDFVKRFSFFFNSHMDFFEEIAKYRAARRIWAQELKKRYQVQRPESLKLRFHTQTAGCSLTVQDPQVNIIRTTLEALAAVLGGTQSLHTNSYDEAIQLPSEEAVTLALRTQQIIAEESGIKEVVDPLGGSYYLEHLTNEIEKQAYGYFDRILEMGNGSFLDGVFKGIELGFFKREIANAAHGYQKRIETEDWIVIGVNLHPSSICTRAPSFIIHPETEEEQIKFLQKIKSERDNLRVNNVLRELEVRARTQDNLVPYILDAVKSYATLGEIINTLKKVFGTYREPIII